MFVCSTSDVTHSSRKRFSHEYRTKFYITRCENAGFIRFTYIKTLFFAEIRLQIFHFLSLLLYNKKVKSVSNARFGSHLAQIWISSSHIWVRFGSHMGHIRLKLESIKCIYFKSKQ